MMLLGDAEVADVADVCPPRRIFSTTVVDAQVRRALSGDIASGTARRRPRRLQRPQLFREGVTPPSLLRTLRK